MAPAFENDACLGNNKSEGVNLNAVFNLLRPLSSHLLRTILIAPDLSRSVCERFGRVQSAIVVG